LQAIWSISLVRYEVDDELGGSVIWLNEIEDCLREVERQIMKLAVAEGISMVEDELVEAGVRG
jgi:hypothetical protein